MAKMYMLEVKAITTNDNYATELEAYRDMPPYRRQEAPSPEPYSQDRVLSVTLTEEEWLAVKKACVEAMK